MIVKAIKFLLLICVLCLSATCPAAAGEVPADVMKAAKEGFDRMIKGQKYNSRFQKLGFDSQEDIDKALVGEGFQVFTISPDDLFNDAALQDIKSVIIPINEWDFIIHVDGEAKCLLKVSYDSGRWFAFGMGSSILSKEINGIKKKWPASLGHDFRFIRVYQASSDLVELSQKGNVLGLIPLTSVIKEKKQRIVGEFATDDLHNGKEVLLNLRPAVKSNIEHYERKKK